MADTLCLLGDPQLMECLADCFSFDHPIMLVPLERHDQFSPFDFEGFPLIWRPPIID